MRRGGQVLFNGVVSLVLAFLVLPTLVVLPASLNHASFIEIPPAALSVRWYREFFADPEWLASLGSSLRVAVLATSLSVLLGTTAALGLERLRGTWRSVLSALFLAPLVVPAMVLAVALYYVARPLGLAGTTTGLALGHTLMCLPYVVINVGISLKGLDPSLERAAEGLGAGPWRVFRTVTLPGIAPGLAGGAIFAAITSFDELIVSIFLAGVRTQTLPVKLWETIRVEFTPVVAVASSVIIAASLLGFLALRLSLRLNLRRTANARTKLHALA
jgi:putative spermidine/putrescine transport system permease protein